CALVGLDTLGQVSSYGAETFTWLIFIAIFFLLPYALAMAELGTAFTQEGGPYEWMKLSWGRLTAGIGAVLYWVTNPFWVGGSGLWIVCVMCVFWAALGSWVAVFPDTLEYLFGANYNFQDTWGVSRLRFEVF